MHALFLYCLNRSDSFDYVYVYSVASELIVVYFLNFCLALFFVVLSAT